MSGLEDWSGVKRLESGRALVRAEEIHTRRWRIGRDSGTLEDRGPRSWSGSKEEKRRRVDDVVQ